MFRARASGGAPDTEPRGHRQCMQHPGWRTVTSAISAVVLLTGLTSAVATPADAASSSATKTMLDKLAWAGEHTAGYCRSKFQLWTDADHDSCDIREEVLLAESKIKATRGAGCRVKLGRWVSAYDGVTVTNPTGFDIDHMVPLNEAWQSGAWKWNAATGKAYANDLGYRAGLIAVSAHTNRSKGDREPQNWMPPAAADHCTYAAQWVAVKWRWHLKVNMGEWSDLYDELQSCNWPRVATPNRPTIHTSSAGSGGSGSGPAARAGRPSATRCTRARSAASICSAATPRRAR
jgi:Protein of unknown function (DUF1524)